MQNKTFKIKDMIIAVICTILVILSIVFYFLPAFNIQHTASIGVNYEQIDFSAWDMTRASFTKAIELGSGDFDFIALLELKQAYGMPIFLAGILAPIVLLTIVLTTAFAYLAWLKDEKFKKFCFLFGLVSMMFATIVLVAVWFMALKIKTGEISFSYLNVNVKGNISYGSFVSLILAFVIAIVSCAYNYFIDSGDEEYDDEDEDEDNEEDEDEEEEEEVEPKKKSATTTKNTMPKTPTKSTSTTRFIKKK